MQTCIMKRTHCTGSCGDQSNLWAVIGCWGHALATTCLRRLESFCLQEVLREAGAAFDTQTAAMAGVYIGCMYSEYLDGVLAPQGVADAASAAVTGHGLSFLVGRVSYTFGLQVRLAARSVGWVRGCLPLWRVGWNSMQ